MNREAYAAIAQRLKDMGVDTRLPLKGEDRDVYTAYLFQQLLKAAKRMPASPVTDEKVLVDPMFQKKEAAPVARLLLDDDPRITHQPGQTARIRGVVDEGVEKSSGEVKREMKYRRGGNE